jgi:hypothetical protein
MRRIQFVLGLGLLVLIPVGYLALPDHRDKVAGLPLNDLAAAAVSENRGTSLPGSLTQTDKSLAGAQPPTRTTPKNPDNAPGESKTSFSFPPGASGHESILVAGVLPRSHSGKPGIVDSPNPSEPADSVRQGSKSANAVSFASPNPAPSANTSTVTASGSNGALAGFVAIQGNDVVQISPTPKQTRELHGYITVTSNFEPATSTLAQPRPAKRAEHRASAEDTPLEPRERAAKTADVDGPPPTSADQSDQLQSFASDFVRSEGSENIGEQRRFYAESVHFYHEGDLSWAGVAAATRRYRQDRQNKQFRASGAATVKGPVDGGFYLVDQAVSWTRLEGSSQVRGRSLLRLRVLPSSTGWKITSIEEVGQ